MDVYIGNDTEPFKLHKDLASASSSLFRRYRNEDALNLPDEEPHLFELYAQWLYSKNSKAVFKDLRAHELVKCDDGTIDQPGAETLFHLFCLGERIRDVTFKNTVVDAYIDAVKRAKNYPTHLAAWIYERLPENSGFRKLYIDIWCWDSDELWFEDLESRDDPLTAPGAFWLDVFKRKTELGRTVYGSRYKKPWDSDRTQYHETEEETEGEAEDQVEEDETLEVVTKSEIDSEP